MDYASEEDQNVIGSFYLFWAGSSELIDVSEIYTSCFQREDRNVPRSFLFVLSWWQ
jgi:hypothetical protein